MGRAVSAWTNQEIGTGQEEFKLNTGECPGCRDLKPVTAKYEVGRGQGGMERGK